MEIQIDNRQSQVPIDHEIENFIEKACEECLKLEGRSLNYEISVSFVDNEEIRELNRIYRGKDKETDVLSFPMEDDEVFPEGNSEEAMLGDIVISAEKALDQSEEYGHSFEREIVYLTVHSMFHLMGYDHMTEEEKKIMRDREKRVLKKLGIFKKKDV